MNNREKKQKREKLTDRILEFDSLGLILIGFEGIIIALALVELRFEPVGVTGLNSMRIAASLAVNVGLSPSEKGKKMIRNCIR